MAEPEKPSLRMDPLKGPGAAASGPVASSDVAAQRDQARRLWKAVQATPEDISRERAELEKLERALAEVRKQADAANAEAEALQARLADLERQRRYPVAAVWGLGALALLAGGAWLYERRKHAAFADSMQSKPFSVTGPATMQMRAKQTGGSSFISSGFTVMDDEAGQWTERPRHTAVPPGRKRSQ